MKVPIAKVDLTQSEINSVLEPLETGWLVQGPKVREFEEKWSKFVKAEDSVAVTSCTSALHLSLAALDFGPGDEAIVPAFTWISTANVVEHLNGKVVFCDIDLESFNIDVEKIETLITERTKAIIPVHLFGLSADMDPIIRLAEKYKISVVEDAACGFGSKYKDRHVGTFGDTGCFSFHPRKAITTGEGGMITSNSKELIERVRRLRDHGASLSDLQRHQGPKPYLLSDHIDAGYNQRMTDIQAALGSAQMNRANEIIEERQKIAATYYKELNYLEWLRIPKVIEGFEHSYQSYPCLFIPDEINSSNVENIHVKRNKWMDKLQTQGVSTRPSTHAVHMLTFYKKKYGFKKEDFSNAYSANHCSISLPLFNSMSEQEQEYVINQVKKSF